MVKTLPVLLVYQPAPSPWLPLLSITNTHKLHILYSTNIAFKIIDETNSNSISSLTAVRRTESVNSGEGSEWKKVNFLSNDV